MYACLSCKSTSGHIRSTAWLPNMHTPLSDKGALVLGKVEVNTCMSCKQTCADVREITQRDNLSTRQVLRNLGIELENTL